MSDHGEQKGRQTPQMLDLMQALKASLRTAPSPEAQRYDAIMAQVREEQRAGRTPEQELRDALTAIRPLIERDDVEDEEWIHAFEKEVPTLVDAAYRLLGEAERLRALLNTPEIEDFDKAVPLEAAHQVLRWGSEHDDGKNPEDWFWVVGYLAGKALRSHVAGDLEKAKHHTISTAAVLRNWHAHIRSGSTLMRPGIEPPP